MSLNFLEHTEQFRSLLEAYRGKKRKLKISGLIPASKQYFLSVLCQAWKKPIIFIRPTTSSLTPFKEECRFFLSQLGSKAQPTLLPPLFDNPYQEILPSLETVSARMQYLYSLSKSPPSLLITNLPALLKPIPRPHELSRLFCELEPGESIGRDRLISQLAEYGYARQDLVNAH